MSRVGGVIRVIEQVLLGGSDGSSTGEGLPR